MLISKLITFLPVNIQKGFSARAIYVQSVVMQRSWVSLRLSHNSHCRHFILIIITNGALHLSVAMHVSGDVCDCLCNVPLWITLIDEYNFYTKFALIRHTSSLKGSKMYMTQAWNTRVMIIRCMLTRRMDHDSYHHTKYICHVLSQTAYVLKSITLEIGESDR